jgi:hypothetical protein
MTDPLASCAATDFGPCGRGDWDVDNERLLLLLLIVPVAEISGWWRRDGVCDEPRRGY